MEPGVPFPTAACGALQKGDVVKYRSRNGVFKDGGVVVNFNDNYVKLMIPDDVNLSLCRAAQS